MGILTSLLVLSFLIFFHELGHFIAARYLGVKVLTFSIGFGKSLISKTYKGTKYTISMIPLGGFVQMKGQNDLDPSQKNFDKDSYNSKHPLERIVILLAGPLFNFLLAFVIYIFLGLGEMNYMASNIGSVQKDSPAYKADIHSGDMIININNTNIKTWNELASIISKSKKEMVFLIDRNGKIIQKNIKAKTLKYKTMFGDIGNKKMIGISPKGDIIKINHSFYDSLSFAYDRVDRDIKMIYKGIEKMIIGAISVDNLGGIISIAQITSQASEVGFVAVFALMALISVNLGVLNLLPIPALDGGHIVFNVYELITRHSPSEKAVITLTIIGWMILISLMLLGVYNDINRIIG